MTAQGRSAARQSSGRQSSGRSGKAALGAAFVARGLAGSTAGTRKSPGLLGSTMLTLIGGLFFGVGIYVNTHAAELAAKPGNNGSPKVLGWGFVGMGGLVLLIGALTLLSRLGSLIIGAYLLIAGRFETAAPASPAPVPASASGRQSQPEPPMSESVAAGVGGSVLPPLVPPPLDPRLPTPNG